MDEKHNILFLSSGGVSGFSGVNYNIFNYLSRRYETVKVIDNKLSGFPKYFNAFYSFLKTPGYNKYLHPIKEIYCGNAAYYRFRTMYYVLKRTKAAEKALSEITYDYDLVLQTGWIPAIFEKTNVLRCIYTDFTAKLAEKDKSSWSKFLSVEDKAKWFEMETSSYQNADIVFTVSNNTRQSIIEDYGVNENRVVTVYAGYEVKDMSGIVKNYNSNIILFVGIDFERKGGYVLLEAFKKVRSVINDARLIILGSKPDVIMGNVEVKGFVSDELKMHYYDVASVFVMPSFSEPFGLVFLEAMANKLPCIGTNVDAMPEIIQDGETGFLVDPNNSDMLADKIILLLSNKDLMRKMGENGERKVKKCFTWDKVAERMSVEFDKL